MKKIIISVIATVFVMTGIGVGVISNINQNHEKELTGFQCLYENNYKCLEDENTQLKNKINNLETEVYNMNNGKAYDITIDHDGKTYTYASDNKSIFERVHTSILR